MTVTTTAEDCELLELAAKAASIDARRLPHAWPARFDDDFWSPLEDDGDALRLAAMLHLWEAVRFAHRLVSDKDDIYAATRRAIVTAAADIGRTMAKA